MTVLKCLVLAGILLYASVQDYRKHEVPDFVSVMVAVLGLVNVQTGELPMMIFGAVLVFLPQLAVCLINPGKAIGGADIKLSTASAFLLGGERGLLALALGLILAVITVPILRNVRKSPPDEPFPLIPFLSVGIFAGYFL